MIKFVYAIFLCISFSLSAADSLESALLNPNKITNKTSGKYSNDNGSYQEYYHGNELIFYVGNKLEPHVNILIREAKKNKALIEFNPQYQLLLKEEHIRLGLKIVRQTPIIIYLDPQEMSLKAKSSWCCTKYYGVNIPDLYEEFDICEEVYQKLRALKISAQSQNADIQVDTRVFGLLGDECDFDNCKIVPKPMKVKKK